MAEVSTKLTQTKEVEKGQDISAGVNAKADINSGSSQLGLGVDAKGVIPPRIKQMMGGKNNFPLRC